MLSFGFRPCLTGLWPSKYIYCKPESFAGKVQIKLVFIHRAVLCPPTWGDPTHCRDSCRMGGRMGKDEGEGSFLLLDYWGGRLKEARKLTSCPATSSCCVTSSQGSDVILLSLKWDPFPVAEQAGSSTLWEEMLQLCTPSWSSLHSNKFEYKGYLRN